MVVDDNLPVIDISGFINPKSPEDKEKVVNQVRAACARWGFFQISGHGVPLETQQGLFRAIKNFFDLPIEEKRKVSFYNDPCRRGYENAGDSLREGDPLPDLKEAFFIGREEPKFEPPGFHGPNQWPDMPEEDFHGPAWEFFGETSRLGKTIWEMLLQGLGADPALMEDFSERPIISMKMIRYPPPKEKVENQWGIGAHNDFGGVTVLIQEPGRDGLMVWDDENEDWLPVKALENVFIINCGDMIKRWSSGRYKSARHRVLNESNADRLSCATFWHGDAETTNLLDPTDTNPETVGQLMVKRFAKQYKLPQAMVDWKKPVQPAA